MKNVEVDKYLSSFTKVTKISLQKLRELISQLVPEAEEKMSYGIPTFKLNGKNLVHFGGYENHIGFYPGPKAVSEFKSELKDYKTAKGSIQFPIEELPVQLIKRILKYCVEENEKLKIEKIRSEK